METVLKSKRLSYGLIELRQSGTTYSIYVNDSLRMSSSDLNYILNEYNKMY